MVSHAHMCPNVSEIAGGGFSALDVLSILKTVWNKRMGECREVFFFQILLVIQIEGSFNQEYL